MSKKKLSKTLEDSRHLYKPIMKSANNNTIAAIGTATSSSKPIPTPKSMTSIKKENQISDLVQEVCRLNAIISDLTGQSAISIATTSTPTQISSPPSPPTPIPSPRYINMSIGDATALFNHNIDLYNTWLSKSLFKTSQEEFRKIGPDNAPKFELIFTLLIFDKKTRYRTVQATKKLCKLLMRAQIVKRIRDGTKLDDLFGNQDFELIPQMNNVVPATPLNITVRTLDLDKPGIAEDSAGGNESDQPSTAFPAYDSLIHDGRVPDVAHTSDPQPDCNPANTDTPTTQPMWTGRYFKVDTIHVTPNQLSDTVLGRWELPLDILHNMPADHPSKTPFLQNAFVQPHMRFLLVTNTTKFHQGSVLMVAAIAESLQDDQLSVQINSAAQAVCASHIEIDLSQANEGVLDVPYAGPYDMLGTSDLAGVFCNYATLTIVLQSPLVLPTGVNGAIDLTLYAMFTEETTFTNMRDFSDPGYGPTETQIALLEQKLKKLTTLKEEEEEYLFPQGASQSTTNVTNNWNTIGDGNSVSGGTNSSESSAEGSVDATVPVSAASASLKMDLPPDFPSSGRTGLLSDNFQFILKHTNQMSFGGGAIDLNALRLHQTSSNSAYSNVAGKEHYSWKFLNSINGRINSFNVTTQNTIGEKLYEFANSPWQTCTITVAGREIEYPTPLSLGAACHKFFTGNIKLTLKFVKTSFHEAKFRIVLFPDQPIQDRTFENSNSCPYVIVDMKEQNKFAWNIPLPSVLRQNPVWIDSIVTPGEPPFSQPVTYGHVAIFLETPLQVMESVGNTINILPFISGPDIDYTVVIQPKLTQFVSLDTQDLHPQGDVAEQMPTTDARFRHGTQLQSSALRSLTPQTGEDFTVSAENQRFTPYFRKVVTTTSSQIAFLFDVQTGSTVPRAEGNSYDLQTYASDIWKFNAGNIRYNIRIQTSDDHAIANVLHHPDPLTLTLTDVQVIEDELDYTRQYFSRGVANEPFYPRYQPFITVEVPLYIGTRCLINGLAQNITSRGTTNAYRNGQLQISLSFLATGSKNIVLEVFRAFSNEMTMGMYQGHRIMSFDRGTPKTSYPSIINRRLELNRYGYPTTGDEAIVTGPYVTNLFIQVPGIGTFKPQYAYGIVDNTSDARHYLFNIPQSYYTYVPFSQPSSLEGLSWQSGSGTVYPTLYARVESVPFTFATIFKYDEDTNKINRTELYLVVRARPYGPGYAVYTYVSLLDAWAETMSKEDIPGPTINIIGTRLYSTNLSTYFNINERQYASIAPTQKRRIGYTSDNLQPQMLSAARAISSPVVSILNSVSSAVTGATQVVTPATVMATSGVVAAGAAALASHRFIQISNNFTENISTAVARVTANVSQASLSVNTLVDTVTRAGTEFFSDTDIDSVNVASCAVHAYSLIRSKSWDTALASLTGILINLKILKLEHLSKFGELFTNLWHLVSRSWNGIANLESDLPPQPEPQMARNLEHLYPEDFANDPTSRIVVKWLRAAIPAICAALGFAANFGRGYAAASLAMMKELFTSTRTISGVISTCFEFIQGLIHWCLGKEDPLRANIQAMQAMREDITTWCLAVANITETFRLNAVLSSQQESQRVVELKNQGDHLITTTQNDNLGMGVRHVMLDCHRRICELHSKIGSLVREGPKMDPYCLWLEGNAGVGKSTVMNSILIAGLKRLGTVFDGDPVYIIEKKTEYDNLFIGNPAVMWDDFGNINDPSVLVKELGTFYALKSAQIVNANMPDLQNKLTIMNPKLLGVCSNHFTLKSTLISDQGAFDRRANMRVKLSLSPKFYQDYPGSEDLSSNACQQAFLAGTLDVKDYVCFSVYASTRSVVNNNTRRNGAASRNLGIPSFAPGLQNMTYAAFVEYYCDRVFTWTRNQENLTAVRQAAAHSLEPSAWLDIPHDLITEEVTRATNMNASTASMIDAIRQRYHHHLSETTETLRNLANHLHTHALRVPRFLAASVPESQNDIPANPPEQLFTAVSSEEQPTPQMNTLPIGEVPIPLIDENIIHEEAVMIDNRTDFDNEEQNLAPIIVNRDNSHFPGTQPIFDFNHLVRAATLPVEVPEPSTWSQPSTTNPFPRYANNESTACTCKTYAQAEEEVDSIISTLTYNDLQVYAESGNCVHRLVSPTMTWCHRHESWSGLFATGSETFYTPPLPFTSCGPECLLHTPIQAVAFYSAWSLQTQCFTPDQPLRPTILPISLQFFDPATRPETSFLKRIKHLLSKGFEKFAAYLKKSAPKILNALAIASILFCTYKTLTIVRDAVKTVQSQPIIRPNTTLDLTLCDEEDEAMIMDLLAKEELNPEANCTTVSYFCPLRQTVHSERFNTDAVIRACRVVTSQPQLHSSDGKNTAKQNRRTVIRARLHALQPQSASDGGAGKAVTKSMVDIYDGPVRSGSGFAIWGRVLVVPMHFSCLPKLTVHYHHAPAIEKHTYDRNDCLWHHIVNGDKGYDLCCVELPHRDSDGLATPVMKDRFGLLYSAARYQICPIATAEIRGRREDEPFTLIPSTVSYRDLEELSAAYDDFDAANRSAGGKGINSFVGFACGIGESKIGMCGNMLINRGQGKVLGMHVMGTNHVAHFQSITKEMLQPLYDQSVIRGRDAPKINDAPTTVKLRGNFVPFGAVPQGGVVHQATKTKIRPSPMYDHMQKCLGDPARTPVQLSVPGDSYRGQSALENGLSHRCNPHKPFPADVVSRVNKQLDEKMLKHVKPIMAVASRRPLKEGILGIDGTPMRPLYMNTSPGYPYSARKRGATSQDFIQFTDDKKNIVGMEPFLVHKIQQAEKQMREGTVPFAPYQCFLKDENLAPGKQARLIEGCPLEMKILWRQYCSDYFLARREAGIKYGTAIGINIYGEDGDELAKHLLENSTKILADDFSKFGPRLDPDLVRACGRRCRLWYSLHAKNQADLERDDRVRACLFESLANADLVAVDSFFRVHCGSPSGNPFTVDVNDDCCQQYLAIAWDLLMKDRPAIRSLSVRDTAVRTVTYGDDSIQSVKDNVCEEYNSLAISELFGTYGIKYTNADKGEGIQKWQDISTATFLKSYCKRDERRPGKFTWMLDPAMIQDIPRYVRDPCPDEMAQVVDLCKTSLYHAIGGGSEYFNFLRTHLISWFIANDKTDPIPDFETVYALRNGELDARDAALLGAVLGLSDSDMHTLGWGSAGALKGVRSDSSKLLCSAIQERPAI